ncbi:MULTISPECIES: DUF4232 domain-containing protein [unclassified Streptomyces]|uniref:DUF4232 domain-containing protein n=1 Tax=unclassified Streptomyces TaxID=2593676 RepID=UPI003811A268
MQSIRNSRTRFLTSAATVALTALSLTACGTGTGVADEGASAGSATNATTAAAAPAAAAPASPAAASGSSDGDSSNDVEPAAASSKPAAQAPASKAPAAARKTITCEGSNTKTVAAPLNRPVNHMLLTVTNTGRDTCYLYSYPAVRFGEAQSVPPVIEGSRPDGLITLKPGESGYASVNLSAADGSGSHGRTEKSLTVSFRGPSGNESVGASARPSLPAKGVYVDNSLKVTYWLPSMDDAISW